MSGGGSYGIESFPSPIHLDYFNHLALIIVLYTSNGYRTHAIEIGQGSTRFQLPLLYLPERAAIVTMSLIAANKRRLSITFNRSPTRPIPIFSELNRDHQSRTAGRRRKRSFPFVPSTMPLYCIRFLSSTGQPDRDGETKRGGQRTSERERERALHRIKSRPQATRLRIAGLDSLPTRVHRTESWLLKSGSREKFNPNRPGCVVPRGTLSAACAPFRISRNVSRTITGVGWNRIRWKEVGFAAMWDEIEILELGSRWNWGKSRDGERERASCIAKK